MKFGVSISLNLDFKEVEARDADEAERKARAVAQQIVDLHNTGENELDSEELEMCEKSTLMITDCTCVDGFATGED